MAMAYVRCPHAAPSHGLLAHVLPTVVLALAGALFGAALLKIRVPAGSVARTSPRRQVNPDAGSLRKG